jgi:hypothetical protein
MSVESYLAMARLDELTRIANEKGYTRAELNEALAIAREHGLEAPIWTGYGRFEKMTAEEALELWSRPRNTGPPVIFRDDNDSR